MSSNDGQTSTFKIILLGDAAVGKSSIIRRYVDNVYSDDGTISNLQMDLKFKIIHIDGKRIKLELWDTPGQVQIRHMNRLYYRKAHGVLLVFDLSAPPNERRLRSWLDEFYNYAGVSCPESIPKLLVGNKCDIKSKQYNTDRHKMCQDFASYHKMVYLLTSAKDNVLIDFAFQSLVQEILAKRERPQTTPQDSDTLQLDKMKEQKKTKCSCS